MVVDPAGPPCPCGRRGCWERYASGAGLGLLAREAALAGRLDEVVRLAGGDPESVRGEDVWAAAAAGDPAARQVIEEVGGWVGFGLANLACVARPAVLRAGRRRGAGGRPAARSGACHLHRVGRGRGASATRRHRSRRLRRARRGRGCRAGGAPGRARLMTPGRRRRCAPASCSRPSGTRPTPRSRPRPRRWPPASTGSSATTTSGPWASPSAPRSRPSRSSARWRRGSPSAVSQGRRRDGRRRGAAALHRHARGAGRPRPQCGVGGAVHRARAAGARARHRRARDGGPAERGREPRLRHPLRAGGCSAAPTGRDGPGPRRRRHRGVGRRRAGRAHGGGARRRGGAHRVGRGARGGRRARRRRRASRSPGPAAAGRVAALAERLAALREAGATWAVFGWPVDVDRAGGRGTHGDGASSAAAGAGP